MISTQRKRPSLRMAGVLWAVLFATLSAPVRAGGEVLPDPPQLHQAVQFWVRVYTRIGTNAGYLHDQYDLGVVYQTLHFAPGTSRRNREHSVDRARRRIAEALRRLAEGARPLSAEQRRIEALWGPQATRRRLLRAAHDIRFQLGQANRFRAGLIRSGTWQQAVARALASKGLPPELAALPLVESSYNPRAFSKDGAAGLWQFMPSTGRRFLKIGLAVDERLDPFHATIAAAQLLAYNYRILGTWPLAITAYNHGVAGVRRAVRAVGTTNIVALVHRYHTRRFGFASRNFYVSFLAALEVEQHARQYFGSIRKLPEERFRVVPMPAYVGIAPLEHVLGIGRARLRDLNPALRSSVWDGRLDVPKGYRLRLPEAGPRWTTATLATKLGPHELLAAQLRPPAYRVQRGDTLSGIAARYRIGVRALARFNGIRPAALLHIGQRIALPGFRPPTLLASARAPKVVSTSRAVPNRSSAHDRASEDDRYASARAQRNSSVAFDLDAASDTLPVPRVRHPVLPSTLELNARSASEVSDLSVADDAQPVSASQAESLSPALGPTGEADSSADPTDYSVSADGSIHVAAAESLGYYAEWLGVSAMHLRRINHIRFGRPVRIGERLRLDFTHVSREQFEQQRAAYHQNLEAAYFAAHRIEGTRLYSVQSGDSLWTLTRRFPQLPAWLLRQYNPDTDFFTLRPGSRLVIPVIEVVSNGG